MHTLRACVTGLVFSRTGISSCFRRWALLIATILACCGSAAQAQTFQINTTPVPVPVNPGITPLPVKIPITAGPSGLNLAGLSAQSSSAWVAPTVDTSANALVLTFSTGSLALGSNSTATITLSNGTHSSQITVTASVTALNVTVLRDDPTRSRTYAIQHNGINTGSVLVFDPIAQTYAGSITVGLRPTDLAVSADGQELLAICSVSKKIYTINLQTLEVSGTIALPSYTDWGPSETSADVAYGPGNIIYYTDGAWAPMLHVLNRSSGTVLQSTLCGTNVINSGTNFGFGDLVVSNDQKNLFAWAQYGWSAGIASSFAAKFTINSDGTVTRTAVNIPTYPAFARDPLNAPAFISHDGQTVVMKDYVFSASAITTTLRTFAGPVYAMSPNAEVVSTQSAIHERATGKKLYDLPVSSTVQTVTSDYSRLIYFNSTAKALKTVNLLQTLGETVLGQVTSPSNESITLPPSSLQWTPLPGIDRYRVYLGTSLNAVTQATPTSPEYQGQVTGATLTLGAPPAPGATYYWRVDAVSDNDVAKGNVFSFTVTTIASSLSKIDTATITGHASHTASLDLSSAAPGKAWTASASVPWIKLGATTGVTPATLQITLDASALDSGLKQAGITITSADGAFSVPVNLQVDPLALTVIRSDPTSAKVYAISEVSDTSAGTPRAYLLEIDSLLKTISRVARVGTGATDLAIHRGDNRIYVPNWLIGSLLAVNLDSFALERTYAVPPFAGVGYSTTDVYRVSAGKPGRLIVEAEDQWIKVSVFNTATGAVMSSISQREGGGAYDPAGRYYYHGDNNSSGSALHKIDTDGDILAERTSLRGTVANYYGSRTVVMAENGQRVFWNGVVADTNLAQEWSTGDVIYSASRDGRYAFSQTKIYDIAQKKVLQAMPVSSTISAYNTTTGRLVVQNGRALGFYSPVGPGLLGEQMSPANQAIIEVPDQLKWTPITGVTGYRVYLGTSSAAVAAATTASPEYLGEVSVASIAFPQTLPIGATYYWRVDFLVNGSVATSEVNSFTTTTIIPGVTAIEATTVKGHSNYVTSLGLSSATPGKAWSASASAPWIKLGATTGVTPATLQITLDTTSLNTGPNQATITVVAPHGPFVIPINLQVDALSLTVIRADVGSTKAYAISEVAATPANSSRAYLLEIDTLFKTITRVAPVGTGATDLAIHHGDNRIYVPNWLIGSLLAVNLDSFAVERTYAVPPFAGVGYSTSDVYRVSAGNPGRLIVEAKDQWIKVSIFNTATGAVMSSVSQREGGGAYDPAGRYYYHGDNNISNAEIHKFDTNGNVYAEQAHIRVSGANYYGSRVVLLSEDGRRVFWNGTVFNENLVPEWIIQDMIYSVSGDGRYAFSQTKIYDVVQKKALQAMPVSTQISAYNSATNRLIVQDGQTLGFYNPVGLGLAGSQMSPANQASVESPDKLAWSPMPGATGYRVYLGTSSEVVGQATTASPEYLGQVSESSLALGSTLAIGQTYYWRVDIVVSGAVAPGDVQSFTVAPLTPSASALTATTVQGYANYAVSLGLSSSAVVGKNWTAAASAPWVKLVNTGGSTPATLQANLDASQLAAGLNQASITVTTSEGALVVPVRLQVEPLAVTVLRADKDSAKVYAISESTASGSLSQAFLLEFDAVQERIVRAVPAGTGATDFAIHRGDNRIYVTNWKVGALLAVNLDSFAVERTYAVPPFESSDDDVYKISAGGPGRLVVEAEDQWVNISIFDTATGKVLASSHEREGGGAHDPTGRYYYHGDNNSSGAQVHKFDTTGDVFAELAAIRGSGADYYGSRNVIVSADGLRVFWNGSIYSADLVQEWFAGAEIYSTSPDGGIAFGASSVFDVNARKAVMTLPFSATLSAYSPLSGKFAMVQNGAPRFYALNNGGALPAPVLSAGTISYYSARLQWTDKSLSTGFIVQKRLSGSSEWTDATALLPAYSSSATINSLASQTTYEFRIRAVSPVAESTWSNVLSITTPASKPVFDMPATMKVTAGSGANLPVTVSGAGNLYTVTGLPPGLTFNTSTRTITGTSSAIGRYQVTVVATNGFGSGTWQFELTVGATTQNNSRGRYSGLLTPGPVLVGSWTLDRSGNAFTGVLTCMGGALKFKGAFPASGDVRFASVSGLIQNTPVLATLAWDRALDRITIETRAGNHTATTEDETGFASPWDARALPYTKAGLFNSVMLPDENSGAGGPEGYGFISLSIATSGVVQIKGETQLGHVITWSGSVAYDHYIPFYWQTPDAFLWGIISLDNIGADAPPVDGSAYFVLKPGSARKAYPAGFSTRVDVLGSRFTPGKAASDLFTMSNIQMLTLGDGGVERSGGTVSQTFGVAGKKVIPPAASPYQLKLTVAPKTGLVTGSVVVTDPHPSGGAPVTRTLSFRGLMIRKTHPASIDAVGGYFLMPDWNGQVRSGWMEIIGTPAP